MSRALTARPIATAIPAVAAIASGVGIGALALALRLSGLSRVAPDPFYDAAVRSMGTSWHDFLFGALEPGGSVAIDKPAVGLWPQVAATKLLGFHTSALLVPQALAGAASVGLVFLLAAALWGRVAALSAAAALAVLPLAVLTARSDTMDALATMVTLAAGVALLRAARSGGRWPLAAAGAAIGLAFNIKLFQALVPVPALFVLYLAASPLPWRERLARLVACSAVALAVGLSWLAVVSTAPGRLQPWAFGSSNGSALDATFNYNGVERIESGPRAGVHTAAQLAIRPDAPGVGRLVGRGGNLGALLGTELVPALILGAVTLAVGAAAELRRRRRAVPSAAAEAPPSPTPRRLARAGALAVLVWLVTAIALFSAVNELQIRYVETLAPAVALAFGAAVATLSGWARLPAWATAIAVVALLAVPTAHAVDVVDRASSDSGHIGAMAPADLQELSAFLQAHTAHQRYEVASATSVKATSLIARDARPVLMLATLAGHPLTPLRRFLRDVLERKVSYVLVAGRCGPHSAVDPRGCGLDARWAVVHGRHVSAVAGVRLYRVTPAAARRALVSHPPLSRGGYLRRRHGARSTALHPHRRRRVHAARGAHAVVPARRPRHARGR
jgi:4-amino-4-deoxy-L-arabinose transferase-like glycosyltransferase